MKTRLGVLLTVLLCAGCGNDVKGTYVGGRDSLLGSMTFKDDGKVDVVLINGIGGEGTYEVDGDRVRVTANGQTNELTIGSDDCLHGPIMMGTLCKGEKKASASSAAPHHHREAVVGSPAAPSKHATRAERSRFSSSTVRTSRSACLCLANPKGPEPPSARIASAAIKSSSMCKAPRRRLRSTATR
jgi:hypothetical protein